MASREAGSTVSVARDASTPSPANGKRPAVDFGPLEPLLREHDTSDILVNGPDAVYVERAGRLERTDVRFRDNEHLLDLIRSIVSAVGRRVDASSPMVDARLPDGSRANAIIPPLALPGPGLPLRRFGPDPYLLDDLVRFTSLTHDMVRYL